MFGARCFCCDTDLRADTPIDHLLPWSLIGIDGLANLVPACPRCEANALHRPVALSADEDTADADGIMQTANRLMDFHVRFLELAEGFRCRSIFASREADVTRSSRHSSAGS